MAALADAAPGKVSLTEIARAHRMPRPFLEQILADLRRARLVISWRGPQGGYALARPAEQITLGAVIRAVDGELTGVRGMPAGELAYDGPAARLSDVMQAVDVSVRQVLDATTLEDLVTGKLPRHVRRLLSAPLRVPRARETPAD